MTNPARRLQTATPYDPTSDSHPGRELEGRTRNLSGMAVHGWTAVFFGVIAAVPALTIGLGFAGLVGDMSRVQQPHWILATGGVTLGAAAVALLLHGFSDVRRQRATLGQRRAFPLQPWHWDYDWDVRGTADGGWLEARHALLQALVGGLILAMPNWAMVTQPGMSAWGKFIVLSLDFTVVRALWRGCYIALRTRKYGRARLRLQRFPAHPGTTVDLALERGGALGRLIAFDVTLRLVQERYEQRGSGRRNAKAIVCYEQWAKTQYVECTPGGPLEVRFEIPAQVSGCALSERPPRYWELEITAEAPGIDYAGIFLVPIYARV